MSRKKKILAKVEQQILMCKQKLKELEPHIEYNASMAIAYNRTLVEKAILVDRYKKLVFKPTIGTRLKQVLAFPRRQKLICDFFHE